MHPLFEKATGLTETIIAAAIEVHVSLHELKVTDGVSRLILPGANR